VVHAVAFIFSMAPATYSTAQQESPETRFSSSLSDYTASEPVAVDEIPDDEDELIGVKSISIHRFKSKKPVSTYPTTYGSIALIVLEYGDPASATAALGKVPAGAEEEMRKSPELNFVNGAKLYRLIGACLLSAENWQAIEEKLTDAVFSKGKAPEMFVSIACGGKVTVSGER